MYCVACVCIQDLFEAEQDLQKASYAEPDNTDVAALTKKLKVGHLVTPGRGGGLS